MSGGVPNIIDNLSEPGSWADAMRFPPFVEDSVADDGAFLRELNRVKCLFQLRAIAAAIGIPAPTLQSSLDPVEGGADTDASASAPVPTFHDGDNARD